MRVACIGSRDLDPFCLGTCEKLGAWVVECGHELHTGNAPGADQAFARGANRVNPALVHLHLPWYNFERHAIHDKNIVHNLDELTEDRSKYFELVAQKHHPAWNRLSQGAKKLMSRNSSIMLPPPDFMAVDLCLAFPAPNRLGGTGQGMRIAETEGVRLIDLRNFNHDDLFGLCEEIKENRA
jgi:hypothetical protein